MFVLFKEKRERRENKGSNRSQRRRAIRRHLILFVSYRVGEYSGNLSYGLYANYSWGIMRAVSCYVIPRIIVQRIGDARFVIRQTAPTSTIKASPLISDLAIKIDCDFFVGKRAPDFRHLYTRLWRKIVIRMPISLFIRSENISTNIRQAEYMSNWHVIARYKNCSNYYNAFYMEVLYKKK